jgi:hypothetical protein
MLTWANPDAEVNATGTGECTEHEMVRLWHELDYALLVAESDRILADALTPHAVILLHQVATEPAGPPRPPPPVPLWWATTGPLPSEVHATQRSPPSP